MFEAQIEEFPFVAQLPKREKTKVERVREQIKALGDAQQKHGVLIPQAMAVALLGLSKARVNQICHDGRLVVVQVGSQSLITEDSLVAFCKLERKAGRPAGPRSVMQVARVAVKAGMDVWRESRKKR